MGQLCVERQCSKVKWSTNLEWLYFSNVFKIKTQAMSSRINNHIKVSNRARGRARTSQYLSHEKKVQSFIYNTVCIGNCCQYLFYLRYLTVCSLLSFALLWTAMLLTYPQQHQPASTDEWSGRSAGAPRIFVDSQSIRTGPGKGWLVYSNTVLDAHRMRCPLGCLFLLDAPRREMRLWTCAS